MFNRFLYQLMYWLGQSPWDTGITPPEVGKAFQAGDIPSGPALDLGCGTGTNVIFMAKQGRQAIGIDFVPSAIAKARKKAQLASVAESTRFYVADVTRIKDLDLPRCGYALDMGCFHGLGADDQRRYTESLAATLVPGGKYMLYSLEPRKEAGIAFGVSPERVQAVFTPWFDIVRVERGSFWGRESTWFWMKRKMDLITS